MQGSVLRLPFTGKRFNLVTSFDVLYEEGVSSEREAMQEFHRVLVPGGRLFLRLPALEWMRRSHDKAVLMRRRYTRGEVARIMRESGFILDICSYANCLLFPAVLAKKCAEMLLPSVRRPSDLEIEFGRMNTPLARVLALEAPLIARGGLPLGLSIIAAGRKT